MYRQFQRCGLLPEVHEHISLGAGTVGLVDAMTRCLSGVRAVDALGAVTDGGLGALSSLGSLQSLDVG